MTTIDYFDKLETNIVKIVTLEDGKKISQYRIYEQMVDDLELKDPNEKQILKERMFYVIPMLPSIFDNIYCKNINETLYLYFNTDDVVDSLDTSEPIIQEVHKVSTQQEISELSVIRFIIDESITKYLSHCDEEGNTILHKIVKLNDFDSFKKIFVRKDISLFKENKKGETAIDLITDFKISNYLIKYLAQQNEKNTEDLQIITANFEHMHKEYYSLSSFTIIILVILNIILFFNVLFLII